MYKRIRNIEIIDCSKCCFGTDVKVSLIESFTACIFMGRLLVEDKLDNLMHKKQCKPISVQLAEYVESLIENNIHFQTFANTESLKKNIYPDLVHLCNVLNSNIVIFLQINRKFILLNATKIKKYHNCMKLLYTNKKYCLIKTNENLEYAGSVFCIYCAKSFRSFKTHYCLQRKCSVCFNYLFPSEYSKTFCKQKVGNFELQCKQCLKTSYNVMCAHIHSSLTNAECMLVKKCDKCMKYYRSTHVCNVYKCYTCFEHHNKTHFCQIRVRKVRNDNSSIFYMAKIQDYIIVSTLNADYKPLSVQFIYMFDFEANKVSIFDAYGCLKPDNKCQLISEEQCFAKNFTDILSFMNFKKKNKFLCESSLFMEIKNSFTSTDLKHVKIKFNRSHRIQHLQINNCQILDIDRILPFSCLSIGQDVIETYPDFNILCVHIPPCVDTHGHAQLTLKCFLQSIKSSNRNLLELVLNSDHHLQRIKKFDNMEYCLNIFQHKIFLIRTCFTEIDRCVQELSPSTDISLQNLNNFANFSQNIFLGTFIYIKQACPCSI